MLVEGRIRSSTQPGMGTAFPAAVGEWNRVQSSVPPSTNVRAPSGTHGLELLVRVEAGLSSGREVAENPEGVLRAALVGVNPVFPCRRVMGAGEQGRDPTAPHPPGERPDLTIWQVGVVAV